VAALPSLDVDRAMADPQFRADPYPLWERLRSQEPVCRAGSGLWLLTRYDDVDAALRDRRFSSDQARLPTRLRALGQQAATSMEHIFGRSMLHLDPPDHTRLRRRVNGAFTPRRVERLRPLVRQLADMLIDEVQPAGEMDLVADFAYPLPSTVIFELFAIPFADRVRLAGVIRVHREARLQLVLERVHDFAASNTAAAPCEPPGSRAMDVLEQTAGELREYLRHLIQARAHAREDDLLSELGHDDRSHGAALSDDELVGTGMLLLVAGQETTINLIGNGVLALLRNPGELARLQSDPRLITGAIEELLRYDTPIQVIVRVLREAVSIRGTTLPEASEVLAVAAAANRDPDRFPDPDRLNISRTDVGNLSFGGGVHYCLGAPLARLEGEVAFRALITRLPRLRLVAQELRWRPNPFLRGLESLAVQF
jgi:cytochrome P450